MIITNWILVEKEQRRPNNRLEHVIVKIDRRGHAHEEVVNGTNHGEDEYANDEDGKKVYARVCVRFLPPIAKEYDSIGGVTQTSFRET